MVAHLFPRRRLAPSWWHRPQKPSAMRQSRRPRGEGQDGSVRVPLHASSRCERTRLGAGILPSGFGARRLRWTLLSSRARPARARCRRQCAFGGNPGAAYRVSALFRTARTICALALWHERNVEDRRRRSRGADREPQGAHRHHRCGDLCRSRPQISKLGTRPLSRGTRGGHREGPRFQAGAGCPDGGGKTARSTGMTAGSDSNAVAGGLARHIPVFARPAIDWLAVRPGGLYVDATFGGGGYARAILQTADARVISIDRDPAAIAQGASLVAEAQGRLALFEDKFSNLEAIVGGISRIDGIVFDLGVSSMQLDEAARGFSFRLDGPLDMRMSSTGPTAADVVARASERELTTIIAELGEEKRARAVARAIVRARNKGAIESTRALAEIVSAVVSAHDRAIHPATRTFQALRIFINSELFELVLGLVNAERVLTASGRLVAIAFHSLEDRIVKSFLIGHSRAPSGSRHRPQSASAPATFRVLTKRPETPDQTELASNPRARSAKLRAAERIEAPAREDDIDGLLPPLPRLTDIMRGPR